MFVLPDEEGPGAILETRSSKSLLVGSTFLPVPSLPQDARAALCSGRLIDADGRRRSGRDPSRPWRPVRTFHQRVGSKACWSRIMAKATRLARCPSAHRITPLCLPRESRSLA
jgi:hypothetical protein